MEKLKMHSKDFVNENIAKLAELFPNCVTEVKEPRNRQNTQKEETKNSVSSVSSVVSKAIDFDLLRQELATSIVEGPQERYHLNWPGKREALLTSNAPIAKTLRPCRDESVDFDTTENLFIEGDNLDALKLLQETYLGKVKMIYIDPPYNTGKDFIYSDNFAESAEEYLLDSGQKDEEGNRLVTNTDSNGRFHSDWLSMMYSRLKLARNLLKDDGVIFISIDDGEVDNVRKLCDEIFGKDNFLAQIVWQKIHSTKNDAKYYSDTHEYIVCYCKSIENVSILLLPRTEKMNSRFKNPDNDPRGPWSSGDLVANEVRSGGHFEVNGPTGKVFNVPPDKHWVYSQENMKRLVEEGRIWFGKNGDAFPRLKRYLSEVQQGRKADTLWLSNEVGHNQESKREVKALFDGKVFFDTPKPVRLLRRCVEITLSEDDIILDFFAGSATTAHAVMQLNAEDNGKRKFIMVQLPEACDEKSEAFKAGYKTIAEISKERIRRAGKKILEEMEPQNTQNTRKQETGDLLNFGEAAPSVSSECSVVKKLDTGFRVLKIDSSNMADVYYAPDAVKQDQLGLFTDNIKDDRTSEDLLFQVLLDWGVDLTLPITKEIITTENTEYTDNKKNKNSVSSVCSVVKNEVFFVDGNALAACFERDGKITEDFCKELAKRQPLRVVFRDSGFNDDSVKINVEQIFKLMSPHTDVKTI